MHKTIASGSEGVLAAVSISALYRAGRKRRPGFVSQVIWPVNDRSSTSKGRSAVGGRLWARRIVPSGKLALAAWRFLT